MTDKRSNRGDGRDAKGRWVKGTTGNRSGRPPKVPDYDMADVYNFSQFPTEIAIGGEQQLMTRHEVVLLKFFESAMKGRISAQKYLIEKFEQAQMSREYPRAEFILCCRKHRRAEEGQSRAHLDGRCGQWMDNVFIGRLWRSLKYECVYRYAFETSPDARAGIGCLKVVSLPQVGGMHHRYERLAA